MSLVDRLINDLKRYIAQYLADIFLILLFVVIIFIISRLPYFNLIFTWETIFLLSWLLTIKLFKLSGSVSLLVVAGLLIMVAFFTLFKNYGLTEKLGNAIFILLGIGWIQLFVGFLKEEQHGQ